MSTWAAGVLDSMRALPRAPAVRDRYGLHTHGELHERAHRFANALAGQGVSVGTRVAMILEDAADSLVAYLGVGLAGATAVQVNDRLAEVEIAEILALADVRLVVVSGSIFERIAGTVSDRPHVVIRPGSFDDLLAAARPHAPEVAVPPETPGIVGFTSGTTGRPKGVVHTHRNIDRIVRHMPAHDGLRWRSRCAFTGTFAFSAGIWGVMLPHLYLGGELSFMAGTPVDEWVARMVAERSNFTYVPTPLMDAFAAEVHRVPAVLDHLDGVLHSGSSATREAVEALVGAIGPRYVETYGMTETGAPVTATVPDDWRPSAPAEDPLSSAGRPVSIASITIEDDEGTPLPVGEVGQVVVDSQTLFAGYLDAPGLTREAMPDGRLRTGDLGRLDAAGYLYVVGRAKDMIVSGGMNVYPAEVERVLARHPDVADVAVFGTAHPRWGETVTAAVVAVPGRTVDVDALLAFARDQLAGYKKPTAVHEVDELPRNANLKVRKEELRERFTPPAPTAGT